MTSMMLTNKPKGKKKKKEKKVLFCSAAFNHSHTCLMLHSHFVEVSMKTGRFLKVREKLNHKW